MAGGDSGASQPGPGAARGGRVLLVPPTSAVAGDRGAAGPIRHLGWRNSANRRQRGGSGDGQHTPSSPLPRTPFQPRAGEPRHHLWRRKGRMPMKQCALSEGRCWPRCRDRLPKQGSRCSRKLAGTARSSGSCCARSPALSTTWRTRGLHTARRSRRREGGSEHATSCRRTLCYLRG